MPTPDDTRSAPVAAWFACWVASPVFSLATLVSDAAPSAMTALYILRISTSVASAALAAVMVRRIEARIAERTRRKGAEPTNAR